MSFITDIKSFQHYDIFIFNIKPEYVYNACYVLCCKGFPPLIQVQLQDFSKGRAKLLGTCVFQKRNKKLEQSEEHVPFFSNQNYKKQHIFWANSYIKTTLSQKVGREQQYLLLAKKALNKKKVNLTNQ